MVVGDIIIKFENVSKIYNINKKDSIVLNNISFNIKDGDFFGIVGNTGSGKSTILRLMNGYLTPDSGDIFLLNKKLDNKTKKDLVKKTSMIFQNYNLVSNLTVLENILLPTKIRKLNKTESLNKALDLLKYVGLLDHKDQYIKTLSGGQKQRVAIARSLITSPLVLLCDEPTSALDEKMSFEILNLLKDINKKYKTTIVIISHDLETIKHFCNKALILEEGKILDIVKLKPKNYNLLSYKERLLND